MSDATTLPAPDLSRDGTINAAWEKQRRAFYRMLANLLPTHRGRYVAVHDGRVIAEGTDQVDVAKRAYAIVGYKPVYVGMVTDEPPHPVRIPSPRLLLCREP